MIKVRIRSRLRALLPVAWVGMCGVLCPLLRAAQDDIIISNQTFGTGTSSATWANYTIESTGTTTVQSGADVRWSAGEGILIGLGFSVQAGATFSAKITAIPTYDLGGYYGSTSPFLAPLSNTLIYGLAGGYNAVPFDLAIWDESGVSPLVNAPVLVYVENGTGGLAVSTGATPPLPQSLQLTTDQDGTVRFYYYQPATAGLVGRIRVVAGTRSYVFTTQSYAQAPGFVDQDGDGLSDTAEVAMGTDPMVGATQTAPADLGLVIHF